MASNGAHGSVSGAETSEAPILGTKKFLFVSLESLSGDLAWHLTKEGHKVKAYIKARTDQDVYNGFIEKVPQWWRWVDWADVVVFDDVEFGMHADRLRKRGKLVVGGSEYTDRLEIDREFGQMELKKAGVNVLPSWHFSNYDEAIKFIKQHPDRYVFKPSGNMPSGGKGLLFLGQEEDGRDLIALLEQNKEVWQKKAPTFLLQKFVSGVEVAVGAFFNGKDFIYPINVNFEHKRIFPGDIGPFAGEMGTLMYWSEPNYLFQATLEKMRPALQACKYVGYIDINCIVNGRGIYPLEFTSRFGYPTIQIQLEGIQTPAGEWLYRLARGDAFELKTKKGFQIGVRVLIPSYLVPDRDTDTINTYKDLAIMFKNPDSRDGIHIEDVKRDKKGIWRVAGVSGCLLVVTASGTTVDEARRIVYSRLQNIMVPDMFYRTDIGQGWAVDGDKLHTWGYIR